MRSKTGIFCMILGMVSLIAALSLLWHNKREDEKAGQAAEAALAEIREEIRTRGEKANAADGTEGEDGKKEWVKPHTGNDMTVVEMDGLGYIGYLSIPSLEVELPVLAVWDYERLDTAPARYSGSVKTEDLVIGGHSYKHHFRKLRSLEGGETVVFTDMDGNALTYTVSEIEILKENEGKRLVSGEWDLTLFSCNYGAKDRLVIRCEK